MSILGSTWGIIQTVHFILIEEFLKEVFSLLSILHKFSLPGDKKEPQMSINKYKVSKEYEINFVKKIILFLILIALPFILTSCGNETSSSKQPQSGTTSTGDSQQVPNAQQVNVSRNYGIFDMSGEFLNKVNNNPIDRDYELESKNLYQSSNMSTFAELGLESKYTKIWDAELNAIYNRLLLKLTSKEKEELIESQKGWLRYHMKESEFTDQMFKLRASGPILGSQGSVQMQQASKERLRERTLELMEYYFLLGNNVKFLYTNSTK